jgi:hypothetical protein
MRFIPKLAFQIIALALLAACIVLTVYWVVTDSGLYRQLGAMVGGRSKACAMLSTFLVMFVGWLGVIWPLRKWSKMPTMREELGVGLDDGLPAVMAGVKRAYEIEKARNEEMYTAEEYTDEMRQRARRIGVGFLITGLVLMLAEAWMLAITLETGYVIKAQVMILILGPALIIVGVVQIVTGRSVIRK